MLMSNQLPERVSKRTVSQGSDGAQLSLNNADLTELGLSVGGDAKVITYNDRIVIKKND